MKYLIILFVIYYIHKLKSLLYYKIFFYDWIIENKNFFIPIIYL